MVGTIKKYYCELFLIEILKQKDYTATEISLKYDVERSYIVLVLNKLCKQNILISYNKKDNKKNKYFKLKTI